MEKKKIKVIIADDSPVVREILKDMIADENDLELAGEAGNGREAVILAQTLKPDIITMDVMMPVMNGLEAVEEIMAYCPTPILVFSSALNNKEMDVAFNAIANGALDVMEKPKVSEGESYDRIRAELIDKLRMLSGIHVIPHLKGKRKKRTNDSPATAAEPAKKTGRQASDSSSAQPVPPPTKRLRKHKIVPRPTPNRAAPDDISSPEIVSAPPIDIVKKKLVAIGSSTGGPKALAQIFQCMPKDFPLPVLSVQHIAPSFANGLVGWLGRESPMLFALAEDKTRPEPGTTYIAPTGSHMILQRGLIRLTDTPPVNSCRPSVDELFFSVAEMGEHCLGVLLTGMGRDGAKGLKAIKDNRGRTIIQDEETCVIFGMPKAAFDLGAADEVVALSKIPEAIARAITK